MFGFGGRIGGLLAGVFAIALLVGGWQRAVAVRELPPDFDEMVYLPAAFDYRQLASDGDWAGIIHYRNNLEHPPLVKLMFAAELGASDAPVPDWAQVQVGRPIPERAEPAFFGPRWISWVGGMGQLVGVGLVNPIAALGMAVSTYHAKYSAQAYLEGVAGLFAVIAVLLFERAFRARGETSTEGRSPFAPRTLRPGLFLASAAFVGLATTTKYPYGLVVALGLAPFLPLWARGQFRWWAAYAGVALLVFLAFDPFLWPAPISRFLETIDFHWGFSQSEHVKRSGLPWYQPLYWMTHSEPAQWHKSLFFTSLADWLLFPLALIGLWRTAQVRPVFASWFLLGLAFLFVWPTKWPQYILLILPAVAVCAAIGVQWLVLLGVRRVHASTRSA